MNCKLWYFLVGLMLGGLGFTQTIDHVEPPLNLSPRAAKEYCPSLTDYLSHGAKLSSRHHEIERHASSTPVGYCYPSRNGEFLMDTNVIYVPVIDHQWQPSIAFDGTNYLVVWIDYRNGGGTNGDIYGALVSQSGELLNPGGIPICVEQEHQLYPKVAFDGSNYLVVWEDWRDNAQHIYGARISQSGVVLDTEGILISTGSQSEATPSIAFDGTNYLAVWVDMRNNTPDIYGARISPSGMVLDPENIPISTQPAGTEYDPAIAFDGNNYFVIWQDSRTGSYRLYGARITPAGVVVDADGIMITSPPAIPYLPSIVFGGTNYFIGWCDYRNGGLSDYDIWGARITPSGTVLDPNGFIISLKPESQDCPSVGFDGTNYFVIWDDMRNHSYFSIYAARVNQSGAVLDPNGILVSTAYDQFNPAISFDGTNYLAVWYDNRTYFDVNIYGGRITPSGERLDPQDLLISATAYAQFSARAAFNGIEYLVVWMDYRNGDGFPDIYGGRVNTSSVILDPGCIAISNASGYQGYPAVASDGTNYFIAWMDNRNTTLDIYGARVSQSGELLDPGGIPISALLTTDKYCPSIAWDGNNYLVVWYGRPDAQDRNIYGARVNQSGIVLDTNAINISTANDRQYYPSVAFDGVNYLVVWMDYRNGDADIYGARVSQSGEVLDPEGIAICTAEWSQYLPEIAFDGTNYLVAWCDYRNDIIYSDIYGARVTPSGVLIDTQGIAISTGPNFQYRARVDFDGTYYIVVWEDARGDSGPFPYDIYGACLDTSGEISSTFMIPLHGNQLGATTTHGQANQSLITFSGFVDSINDHPANTMRIWGKMFSSPVGIQKGPGVKITGRSLKLEVYPNPCTNRLVIGYQNAGDCQTISLNIYDTAGRLVKQFNHLSANQRSGYNQSPITWYGDDDSGRKVTPGVYFVRLKAGDNQETEKIILLK